MEFNVNSWILYVLVAIIIIAVLAQSVFFLLKAIKRAKEKGMDMSIIKKTIIQAATFTIAPAIAILVGVVSLSVCLGIPLPWLRLSVIGSLSYETVAAANVLGPLGVQMSSNLSDGSQFVTVAWVMTLGILAGIAIVPLFGKKIQKGLVKLGGSDKRWTEILNDAMFLGMISAFLGYVFSNVTSIFKDTVYYCSQCHLMFDEAGLCNKGHEVTLMKNTFGLTSVAVMLVSGVIMAICGLIAKKGKVRWMQDYALPISLICGMAAAIPLTTWLG